MRTETAPLFSWNLLLLITVLMIPSFATALELQLPDAHPGLQSVKPGGPLAKIDGVLLKVFQEYTLHRRMAPDTPFKPRNPFLRLSKGHILVDARTDADGELLLSRMNQLGLHNGSRFGGTVSGWLPIGAIRKAAELDSLQVLSASIPMTNAGDVMSQGDEAQRSYVVRNDYGLSGAGVKVGVLSDSYDHQNGAADDTRSGDLPGSVEVLDDSANCGDIIFPEPCSDEGRAMLQIVHDVAPFADLAFHSAFNGFAGFANGIVSLADAGAQVIVDDVIYLGEPMFMDGVIAQAVDQVKDMGVAYFSAAGNQARNSYEHEFANSGEMLYIDFGLPFGLVPAGYMHDFDPDPNPNATDTTQAHTIPAGQCAIFSVQWDSPFGSEAAGTGTQNDLDVWLVDNNESLIVAYDAHENIPTGEPVEIMQFCNDGLWVPQNPPVFKLIIALWDGPAPGLIKTVLFGSASIDEHATHSGTLYGHANAAGAEAVGAAYYQDTPEFHPDDSDYQPQLESFSSAGGTPILFTADGTPLTAPELRMKPEIVAPDGVNTTFFYPTSDRNGDTIPDFSGTSAAAPHAAGVAALMYEAKANVAPAQINNALESSAINMDVPGFDHDTGYGLIQADAAIGALLGASNFPPSASFSYTTSDLTVTFNDTSTDSDGNIVFWSWDFGDGNTYTSSEQGGTAHTYASSDTYTIILTVTDDDGASDTISQVVEVSEPPQININTPTNLSAVVNGSTVDLSWDDTSTAEEGFEIERANKTRGKYIFSRIGITKEDERSYSDNNVTPGTYKYRVRAFAGDTYSDYSNEALVRIEEVSICGDGYCTADEVDSCPDDCFGLLPKGAPCTSDGECLSGSCHPIKSTCK